MRSARDCPLSRVSRNLVSHHRNSGCTLQSFLMTMGEWDSCHSSGAAATRSLVHITEEADLLPKAGQAGSLIAVPPNAHRNQKTNYKQQKHNMTTVLYSSTLLPHRLQNKIMPSSSACDHFAPCPVGHSRKGFIVVGQRIQYQVALPVIILHPDQLDIQERG